MARGFLLYCATFYAAMAVSADPLQNVKTTQPAASVPSIPPTGVLILVVGALVFWGMRAERQRQRSRSADLSRVAASLGFTFEIDKPREFPNLRRLTPPNWKILSVRNVLRGYCGDVEVIGFDCIEKHRNNRSAIPDTQTTLACFRIQGITLPWFSVTRDTSQNWLPPLALIFGGRPFETFSPRSSSASS